MKNIIFFKAEHGAPWAESTISWHLGVENLHIFQVSPNQVFQVSPKHP